MKKTIVQHLIIAVFLLAGYSAIAQTTTDNSQTTSTNQNQTEMNTYVIVREIPGAGDFTQEDLKNIAIKSCAVVDTIGPTIKWIHSYVTGDKLFCIYEAASEDVIREHARMGGFPANEIYQVFNIFSPATAEAVVQQ